VGPMDQPTGAEAPMISTGAPLTESPVAYAAANFEGESMGDMAVHAVIDHDPNESTLCVVRVGHVTICGDLGVLPPWAAALVVL
jgi:hypothetical protein